MELKTWTHKTFQISEGLKPETRNFQYFFRISEGTAKKCKYCVWIEDDALALFDPSKDFESIVSSYSERWRQWAKGKIDEGDFRNIVLKHDMKGEAEFDLDKMDEKLIMD